MDVVINWGSIVGRPNSSPAQLDAAVANSHAHANKTVLDSVADTAGVLYYGGDAVKKWNTLNW